MSFSSEVKNEICAVLEERECCSLALLNAAFSFFNILNEKKIRMNTENASVARYLNSMIKKQLNIDPKISFKKNDKNTGYFIEISEHEVIRKLCDKLGLISNGIVRARLNPHLTVNDCCKHAAIKGAFIVAGSVTNPKKGYHFEIVSPRIFVINELSELFKSLDFIPRSIKRGSNHLVYFKEKEVIADILNVLGTKQMFFNYHDIIMEKELKNEINRKQNFEQANLDKTVNAAVLQNVAIEKIIKAGKFNDLPESLKEIAVLRHDNPDASLSEISSMVKTPLTKSGVNHRFKKIIEIANEIKEMKERV